MRQNDGMDLGLFLPIANNGWILSTASPQYLPSWELNRRCTLLAEQIGFDFALSMIKWRGFGGRSEFWDHALESVTLTAGLAAVTERIALYCSVQPLTLPPAVFARMALTAEAIAPGRIGVNLVAGWNRAEYAQLGLWPGDSFYSDRYAYARDWLQIVTGLWQQGRFSFNGAFLSVEDCLCQPRLGYSLPIVCAGMSDEGLRFTARNADISFVAGGRGTVARLATEGKRLAAELGKAIKSYALYTIVLRPDDEAARAYHDAMVAGADSEALAGMGQASSVDAAGATAAAMNRVRQLTPFMTPVIVGGPRSVARELAALQTETGIDGVLLTFPDFIGDLALFGETVMPLLRARGLAGAV
jgi:pyrimidine oxygenase